jgi:hypothetical protein
MNFFSELKRRNVYKVAVAYAVFGWLLVQIATQVFPFFEIPNWAVRLVVLLIIIGFPIALVIAWAFEATPQGIKRTDAADAAGQHSRGKAWIYVVAVGAALSIGLFFLGRYTASTKQSGRPAPTQKSIAVLPFANLYSSRPAGHAMLRDPRVKAMVVRFGFPAYWREKGWPAGCRPLGETDFECD